MGSEDDLNLVWIFYVVDYLRGVTLKVAPILFLVFLVPASIVFEIDDRSIAVDMDSFQKVVENLLGLMLAVH